MCITVNVFVIHHLNSKSQSWFRIIRSLEIIVSSFQSCVNLFLWEIISTNELNIASRLFLSRSLGSNKAKPTNRALEYKTLEAAGEDWLFLRWSNVIASRGCSPNNKRQSAVFKWKSEHRVLHSNLYSDSSRLCLYRQIHVDDIKYVDIF